MAVGALDPGETGTVEGDELGGGDEVDATDELAVDEVDATEQAVRPTIIRPATAIERAGESRRWADIG
ncbi:MAG TPA: hypothetical protein VG205_05845 [Acidimicrobiales bacterium]|nr:hypothetical protein [Acidimicrobiales bacterium]